MAYAKTFKRYLPESFVNLKAALRLLDEHDDYTYCIEQVVLLREYWRKYPEDRAKLKRYATAGRLYCAPGMFTMPDSNIPSGESFIRNALIGRKWLLKHLGIAPTCCWMADIFGHNPQSPQLAKTCGFTSYMFERGKAGSWKTTFKWKGIDGTVIPAHWQVDTYYGLNLGLAWTGSRPVDWIDRRIMEEVITPQREGSPCKDVLMTPLGGDFLKPTGKHWQFIHGWNRRNKKVFLKFSNPDAYFNELEKSNLILPEEKNDLNPLCEGCFSSQICLKQYNRKLEEMAASLEALESLSGSSHRVSDTVWEALTFNAFHDIICGSLVNKAADEALKKYRRTEKFTQRKIRSLISSLTGNGKKAMPPIGSVLFNSLPYSRKEIVNLPGQGKSRGFKEVKLPPMGFAFVRASGKNNVGNGVRITREGRSIENEKIKVIFGQNGTIISLYDKASGQELATASSGMNNPIITSDIGDPWTINGTINASLLRTAPFHNPKPMSGVYVSREGRVDKRCADADCYDWPKREIVVADPLQGTVQLSYPDMHIKTQITLRKNDKLLRIKTFFMPFGRKYRLLVAFPTSIRNGKIRHSVPCGHLARPEGEYGVQGWMDYADSRKGLLLLNKGLPGNNVTDNVMMLSLFRAVSMEKVDKTPGYEEGIEQVFEYGIMPFTPTGKMYNPAREAALFNREVCILPVSGISMERLARRPLVELKGDGAELSCLRRENGGLWLRLWENRGKNSRVKCLLATPVKACVKMNAAGTMKIPQPFHGNTIDLHLKPFEIVTLWIK